MQNEIYKITYRVEMKKNFRIVTNTEVYLIDAEQSEVTNRIVVTPKHHIGNVLCLNKDCIASIDNIHDPEGCTITAWRYPEEFKEKELTERMTDIAKSLIQTEMIRLEGQMAKLDELQEATDSISVTVPDHFPQSPKSFVIK